VRVFDSFVNTKIPQQCQINSDNKEMDCSSNPDQCFNGKNAAKFLDKSQVTIHLWKKQGKISPDHSHGKRKFYSLSYLQSFQSAYKTSDDQPDNLSTGFSNHHLGGQPPILTTPTYETEVLMPFKNQIKVLEVLTADKRDHPQLLFMFLGMLIVMVIKLLFYTNSESHLLMPALQLQEGYLQLQTQQQQISPQRIQIDTIDTIDTMMLASTKESSETSSQSQKDGSQQAKQQNNKRKKYYGLTLWQKAVAAAHPIFMKLVRATNDFRLDDEERERGRQLISKIFGPYLRLTKYITKNEPGTARHDVAFLLLAKRPKDYGIERRRWTIRLLAKVCKDLGTKNARRSTVGNILKELNWNCSIKPKLISPDPEYGPIIFHLGMVFNTLGSKDRVVFNDEFKFTSSKIAEYLKKKQAPAGWDITLPFGLHRPFYKTKAAIKISGLLTGKSKKLLVKELKNENFDGYYKVLTGLLDEVLGGMNGGKLYLIVDNAPNHQPNILRSLLLKKYDRQVEVLILPRYSPNHNPIERIWRYLLEVTERAGNSEDELRRDLETSVNTYNRSSQNKAESPLQHHCEICGKKWRFSDDTASRIENELSLKKHLCFRIEGLNPYIIYVLTHSLETLQNIDNLDNLDNLEI